MQDKQNARFFLAAKSDRGFKSYFSEFTAPASDVRTFILKGGPGSGKSTLMKKLCAALDSLGHEIELYPCASDTDSLDGFFDRSIRAAFIDGTAPHTLDPRFPGSRDALIDCGGAWDEKLLREKRELISKLSLEVDEHHARASACIGAAGILLRKNRALAERYVDRDAVRALARDTLIPRGEYGGADETRLLSAVSVGKTAFFKDTIPLLCRRIVVLPDAYGAASHAALALIREAAHDARQRAIVCPCSVSADKLDHVLLPDADICFTAATGAHSLYCEGAAVVDGLYRTMPRSDLAAMKELQNEADALLIMAAAQVECAKDAHDALEAVYVSAMNFTKLDAMYESILEKLAPQCNDRICTLS